MNEGARQANQQNYQSGIEYRLDRIIRLLQEISEKLSDKELVETQHTATVDFLRFEDDDAVTTPDNPVDYEY